MAKMRIKDYNQAIRNTSGLQNKDNRIYSLQTIFTKFFDSEYMEEAIETFEQKVLNSDDKTIGFKSVGIVPRFGDLYVRVARYYSAIGEYSKARDLIGELLASEALDKNVSLKIKVNEAIEELNLWEAASRENPDEGAIEGYRAAIDEVAREDNQNVLENENAGVVTDYDLFRRFFNDTGIPVANLTDEIFPPNMVKPDTNRPKGKRPDDRGVKPDVPPTPPERRNYREELSANNRLQFIINHFPIEKAYKGTGNYKGTMIFVVENSNLVIVEKFFEDKNGIPVESYGQATYILPKDQALDLIQLQRGEIRARKDKEPRIQWATHTGDYYAKLMLKYEAALRGDIGNPPPGPAVEADMLEFGDDWNFPGDVPPTMADLLIDTDGEKSEDSSIWDDLLDALDEEEHKPETEEGGMEGLADDIEEEKTGIAVNQEDLQRARDRVASDLNKTKQQSDQSQTEGVEFF